MALKGTLADVGAVDLLQFAHTGRKTGELVLTAPGQEARLFYEKGQLVHAALDDTTGLDVLVEVVGWAQAEFEFHSNVLCEERSIHVDLPRAVMYALKLRDERALASTNGSEGQVDPLQQALAAKVSEFLAQTATVEYVCIDDGRGRKVSAGGASEPTEVLERVKAALHQLLEVWPREGLGRVFLQDSRGTAVLARIDGGGFVIVLANAKASFGMVSVALGRLVAALG